MARVVSDKTFDEIMGRVRDETVYTRFTHQCPDDMNCVHYYIDRDHFQIAQGPLLEEDD